MYQRRGAGNILLLLDAMNGLIHLAIIFTARGLPSQTALNLQMKRNIGLSIGLPLTAGKPSPVIPTVKIDIGNAAADTIRFKLADKLTAKNNRPGNEGCSTGKALHAGIRRFFPSQQGQATGPTYSASIITGLSNGFRLEF